MSGRAGAVAARRVYMCVAAVLTLAHPALPTGVRSVTYLLVSALTVVPLTALVRRMPRHEGAPWAVLLAAMGVMTAGNALTAFGGPAARSGADLVITVAHVLLLVAASLLVLRRGRKDIGGVLDAAVGAIGLGGLIWTVVLLPRLTAMRISMVDQSVLLISTLVLVGVLGALVRVWRVGGRRVPALSYLVCALLTALAGNIVLAMTTGSMTTQRPGWLEMFFMLAYSCVGLCALDPSAEELSSPAPAPADVLSAGRLVFLGAALMVSPAAGGIREMAGLTADAPLLALGTLLVVPLVMIRVGRLAAERQRAEHALRHQATHDPLTGLPNRGELLTRLEAALDRERRSGRPSVVLLFCDLNGFKAVNDGLGHLAGDELLTSVGARIGAGLRAGDTLARYGGDEFLVLCDVPAGGSQAEAARRLTAHIERALHEPFLLGDGPPVHVSTSVGAVLSPGDLGSDELIRRADQAMYAAKQRRATVPV